MRLWEAALATGRRIGQLPLALLHLTTSEAPHDLTADEPTGDPCGAEPDAGDDFDTTFCLTHCGNLETCFVGTCARDRENCR